MPFDLPSRLRALVLAVCASILSAPSFADAGWLEAGDVQLRNDLLLLNDARVIRLPVGQWPIPRAALAYALENSRDHFATNDAVALALERVRLRMAPRAGLAFDAAATGAEPSLLRTFDTLGREEGEITGSAAWSSGRVAVGVRGTAVTSPVDGQQLRADGSHATLQLGNWLVSAHTLDRWWGPGHESSLILSSNARPMPTFMIERAAAKPFESRWLDWLGPWRMSFGVSQMEDDRADIDSPLFMAWRVSIMPFHDIELGASRTAQFCGEQLECNLDTFGNMLAGNDNVGIDATPENEPGNQMAGFDIRWTSPIGNWPYAIYSQMIGEDESSYLPAKYIAQHGIEVWKPFGDGALLQSFVEYTNTICSAHTSRGPYFNCAYRQGRFSEEGYRYRGRVIGHTLDNDAESVAVGAAYTAATGSVWSATLRGAHLNRDNFDPNNTVSDVPRNYASADVGWRGKFAGGELSLRVGVESLELSGGEDRQVDPYGFLNWRHDFEP